jgi:hypothetical protein
MSTGDSTVLDIHLGPLFFSLVDIHFSVPRGAEHHVALLVQ